MSDTGAKFQNTPVARNAFDADTPICSCNAGFHVAPRPIWWGNIVAEMTLLCPCTPSAP